MDIRPVDPRDTETEVMSPAYRVYFWERPSEPGVGVSSYEYEVTGADDVQAVIAWAELEAGPRHTFGVYVVVERSLIRLLGRDPNAAT